MSLSYEIFKLTLFGLGGGGGGRQNGFLLNISKMVQPTFTKRYDF